MRITALSPDPRHPGAIQVEIDGARFGAVEEAVAAAEGLAVGCVVDDALGARLTLAADREAAYRTVLRALERRAYARADLGRRLVRRGHSREAVEAALDRAEGVGVLDDAAYALHYVQTRSARGKGPARLVRDLLARGVDRAHIDRALAAESRDAGDVDEAGAVPLALATKRAAQLGDLPRQTKRRRLLAYLARRGYAGYEMTRIVGQVVP